MEEETARARSLTHTQRPCLPGPSPTLAHRLDWLPTETRLSATDRSVASFGSKGMSNCLPGEKSYGPLSTFSL